MKQLRSVCPAMMCGVATTALSFSAPAHGKQPGDQGNEVSILKSGSLRTDFSDSALAGLDPQDTSAVQPNPAEGTLAASSDGWVIEGGAYIFLPGIDGEASIAGATAELDLSFSDIFNNFDIFALSGRVEAWKDEQWGIIFDGMYTDIDGRFSTPGPLPLAIDVDIVQVQIDLGFGLRVLDVPLNDHAEGPRLRLDALGGGRYQYFKEELTISPFPTLGGSRDWVEPFVGGRVALQLNEEFGIIVRGDAGGFGIGSASDLTWNLFAGVAYRFNETLALRAGYKVQGFDYSSGSGASQFGADWTMQGLLLAMTMTF